MKQFLKFLQVAFAMIMLDTIPAHSLNLPAGYTELEYIESAGVNSYINMGDAMTSTMSFEIKFADVVAGSWSFTLIGSQRIGLAWVSEYGWFIRLPHTAFVNNFEITEPVTDILTITPTSMSSQNHQSTWRQRSDTNTPGDTKLWVFKVQSGKLYHAKVWDNETIIHELIPAKRISDGKAGVYDLVTNRFFASAGNAAFIAGPALIKIATTAHNAAAFESVEQSLNATVATIRDIVTNTINQTAAIAQIASDKQTRPDESCPAGKKCLLVETEEIINGETVTVPHWYPIIESIEE